MAVQETQGRSLIRIADILDCFSVEEPVHNLTSISKRLGLAKSTTHRLLTTMVNRGVLMREADGYGYHLGYQLLHWGFIAQASVSLRNEALPVLRALCEAVDETTMLTVRDGTRGRYLEVVESSQPVRLTKLVGQPLWLHAGAAAKVLWAFLPETEIERLLDAIELLPILPGTITDPARLRSELTAIRARGYATSFEEDDPGAMGIAAPVYDHTGQLVAGIGIAAPLARIPPVRVPWVAVAIVNAAQQLSRRLGASYPNASWRCKQASAPEPVPNTGP